MSKAKKWTKGIGICLAILLSLGFLGLAITNIVMGKPAGSFFVIGWVVLGSILAGAIAALMWDILGHEGTTCTIAFLFFWTLFMMISSFAMDPFSSNGFVALERNGETRIFNNAYVFPLSGVKIFYIDDINTESIQSISIGDNRKVEWTFKGRFELNATIDEAYNIIARFGSIEKWKAEVDKVFSERIAKYLARTFTSGSQFPAKFIISLDDDMSALKALGYVPSSAIKAGEMRIVTTGGK